MDGFTAHLVKAGRTPSTVEGYCKHVEWLARDVGGDDPWEVTGVHPYADKFPMLREPELAELVESITANGLRVPIVVTPDGLILDGRNRLAAWEVAHPDSEVRPNAVIYDGDDLAQFVLDANSHRRHQSTGAKAMSTALVLDADGQRKDGRWADGSVGRTESGTHRDWRNRLTEAGIVLDHRPDLARAMPGGWTCHTLRHRFATQAYRSGRDLRAVQELLGHSKPETTARYAAIPNGALLAAVAGVGLPKA